MFDFLVRVFLDSRLRGSDELFCISLLVVGYAPGGGTDLASRYVAAAKVVKEAGLVGD